MWDGKISIRQGYERDIAVQERDETETYDFRSETENEIKTETFKT